MTLPLFCLQLYQADDWNINSIDTCSLMANLQWVYIKCVMRVGSRVSLTLNIERVCHLSRMPFNMDTESVYVSVSKVVWTHFVWKPLLWGHFGLSLQLQMADWWLRRAGKVCQMILNHSSHPDSYHRYLPDQSFHFGSPAYLSFTNDLLIWPAIAHAWSLQPKRQRDMRPCSRDGSQKLEGDSWKSQLLALVRHCATAHPGVLGA